jgi:hypothetical protein
MSKKLGQLIQQRMDALTNSMEGLKISDKIRQEIAFQIAELSPEFEAILEIIKKADKGKGLTRQDLCDLHGMVRFHWPMHLRPLVRYLDRAFDELDEKQVDTHIEKLKPPAEPPAKASLRKTAKQRLPQK